MKSGCFRKSGRTRTSGGTRTQFVKLMSFIGKRQRSSESVGNSLGSSISTNTLEATIDRLVTQRNRQSIQKNYHCVWKLFNKFYLRLDKKPGNWKDRVTLFVGYLIENKRKASTIRSYISAIKR